MSPYKRLEKIEFDQHPLEEEYYECSFVGCDFSNQPIGNTHFEKCEFISCNLSLCKFKEPLRGATFVDCKMTGADFTELSRFSSDLIFENSLLSYVNFTGLKMRKIIFRNCDLNEAYFDDADIAFSIFDRCNLTRATFNRTNLEGVDFYSSHDFTINPSVCKLKNAIFAEQDIRGLVAHLNIKIKP